MDAAVRAAAAALPAWAETQAVERARVMFRFREVVEKHSDELARLVTREHGKTMAESRASVQRGVEMIEFACGIPSLIMGQTLPNIASTTMPSMSVRESPFSEPCTRRLPPVHIALEPPTSNTPVVTDGTVPAIS